MKTTTWKFSLGDRVKSRHGETGIVTARSETLSDTGQVWLKYRLDETDPVWQQTARVWVPEQSLSPA